MSTVTTKNYKVRLQFARGNAAQAIYEYGCLDCYDYDLYKTLIKLGVNTKPVKEYSKVLDWGCTYKHRKDIRKEYIKAIKYALLLVETYN